MFRFKLILSKLNCLVSCKSIQVYRLDGSSWNALRRWDEWRHWPEKYDTDSNEFECSHRLTLSSDENVSIGDWQVNCTVQHQKNSNIALSFMTVSAQKNAFAPHLTDLRSSASIFCSESIQFLWKKDPDGNKSLELQRSDFITIVDEKARSIR